MQGEDIPIIRHPMSAQDHLMIPCHFEHSIVVVHIDTSKSPMYTSQSPPKSPIYNPKKVIVVKTPDMKKSRYQTYFQLIHSWYSLLHSSKHRCRRIGLPPKLLLHRTTRYDFVSFVRRKILQLFELLVARELVTILIRRVLTTGLSHINVGARR